MLGHEYGPAIGLMWRAEGVPQGTQEAEEGGRAQARAEKGDSDIGSCWGQAWAQGGACSAECRAEGNLTHPVLSHGLPRCPGVDRIERPLPYTDRGSRFGQTAPHTLVPLADDFAQRMVLWDSASDVSAARHANMRRRQTSGPRIPGALTAPGPATAPVQGRAPIAARILGRAPVVRAQSGRKPKATQ